MLTAEEQCPMEWNSATSDKAGQKPLISPITYLSTHFFHGKRHYKENKKTNYRQGGNVCR